jgi:hypothetical protein
LDRPPGLAVTDDLDRESLLRIPLVAQLLSDSSVAIACRGVDMRWSYAKSIDRRVSGFNPFQGVVFTGRNSCLAAWLEQPGESARRLNFDDRLVGEVLFAVHDYLHIWSYRWIARLWPELGFGEAEIGPENFEDMVFCHLLSEAAATVGLDYWYLSCVELNDIVPIGSAKRGLTVSYREDHAEEYRNFSSGFDVQCESFFGLITQFYCSGQFPGFSAQDLQLSPVLRGWLMHELEYGQLQREYCREWFAYLSAGRVRLSPKQLGRPVAHDGPKHEQLMREIGALLWAKVKQGDLADSTFRFDPDRLWTSDGSRDLRFQFLNLNRTGLPSAARWARLSDRSATYLIHQYISRLDYGAFPKEGHAIFDLIHRRGDLALAESLLGRFPKVEAGSCEPRDIFLYN